MVFSARNLARGIEKSSNAAAFGDLILSHLFRSLNEKSIHVSNMESL
jgi:hypothetical protein